MCPQSAYLRLEELESRLVPTLPAAAPSLGAPPPPGPNAIWVHTEVDLQAAVQNLQSGQTVVIQKGVYNLSQTLYLGLARPLQNVTLRGETDDFSDVVLLGHGMDNANYGNVPMGISVWNAQRVTLADLSVGEVYYHPLELKGDGGADQVHLYHARLFNGGEQLLKSQPNPQGGGVTNSTIEYSVLEYTNGPPVTDHGPGTGYTDGIDVLGGTGWVIRNNLFRNFHTPDTDAYLWNPAVLMWGHSAGTVVGGNTFLDTDRAIAFGLILQATGYDQQGGIIRNNFFYQSPGLFTAARKLGSDGQILVWDSPGSLVYHNTILTNGNSNKSIEGR